MNNLPPPAIAARAALTALSVPILGAYKEQAIEYVDRAPKEIVPQISLVEYFERIKRVKADRWQRHFCEYLQNAVVNRHVKPTWAEFHAQAQLGKTTILSQTFPAWCIGHDPLWQTVLAMYNSSRSEAHSVVVIQTLRSKDHIDIFPSDDGKIPKLVSREGWMTNARRELNDGQNSFSAVGLQSGMTGTGFDALIIDDPYKEPKDAWSETVYNNLATFWGFGVNSRLRTHSCVFAMFHRYNYDDFGGYLLNTGKFDYVRYASVADGPYVHEESGQKFEDPLRREPGELICPERFGERYYTDKRSDSKVWMSMFQGRPGKEEGEFFQVGKIGTATLDEFNQCTVKGRGWDHAATADAGDRSAGVKVGIHSDGSVIVADVFSEQIDSASRVAKQKELAQKDGREVTVVIPEDKAAAGKDVVFFTKQHLEGFNVIGRPVTNAAPGSDAKMRRAYNLSAAVNAGRVKFIEADWTERLKRLMRRFGNSLSGDDEIDAMSDVFNFLNEQFYKGLVIKGFDTVRHLRTWDAFRALMPQSKIPAHWTVYAAVKVSADASKANTAAIVARAAENSGLGEMLFAVAEYKDWTDDPQAAFDWLDLALKNYCQKPTAETAAIWLHPDSQAFKHTLRQKLGLPVAIFPGDDAAGVSELNWYLSQGALIGLIADPAQVSDAVNEYGLVSMRQEFSSWAFDKDGKPNKTGAVADCIRMITHAFRTVATDLTPAEKKEAALPEHLRATSIAEVEDPVLKDQLLTRRRLEEKRVEREAAVSGNGRGVWRRR